MQVCLSLPAVGLKAANFAPTPPSYTCRCHNDNSTISVPSVSTTQCSVISSALPKQQCRLNESPSTLVKLLLPVAAACSILTACPAPVEAGIFSGLNGLESIKLPPLPSPDFLQKMKQANAEKYKAFDSNFKKSPFLQDLLKKSKENKELHKKEIQDKYCERGAEWGVGDCSLIGLPQADRDAFFETLRKGKVADGDSGK